MLTQLFKNVFRTFTDVYTEFSCESTIHGIKYTTQGKSTTKKIVWTIIIIAYLLFALQLVSLHYERRASGSISTTILTRHYPTWKLTLPAVTFCPNTIVVANKVPPYITSRKTIYMPRGVTYEDFENALKYLREAIFPGNYFAEELDKLQQILTANRMSVLDLLEHVSPNCSDFMVLCRLEEEVKPCETLIEPVVTPYGICCSFNYENHDERKRLDNVIKKEGSAYFGDYHVMSVLMRSETVEERVSSMVHGDGVKVLIHEQHSYPGLTSQEFVAPLGYETVVRLYGNSLTSSQDILQLPPETRDCFSAEMYRVANCYAECHKSTVNKLCRCVPFYAPNIGSGEQMCNLSHTSCLAHYRLQIESVQLESKLCLCRPECETTRYDFAFSTIPLNAAQYNPGRFYKAAREVPNATVLHITFASQTASLGKRELYLSVTILISSLGGIFGLFLGCSFISVFEIIYLFTVGLFKKLQNR